jgi:hypothetical protein
MAFRVLLSLLFVVVLDACISTKIRLPSSARQVNKNENMQQLLLLAAQNNILFYIPEATTRAVEKTEINQKCREIEEPLWAEKLSSYLNEFRKRPEYLTRFHVIEVKRGDTAQVQVQKDLDGAVTLSIQFVKVESRGKVGIQTKLPCSSSIAEFLNREIVKTEYEFPKVDVLNLTLQDLSERPQVPRFQFSNLFLSYLAERGVIFKFSHEMSFEKTAKGQYVMAEIINKLGEETKQPFHQYLNYWFKQISEQSTQAQVIQMFAVIQDKGSVSGVRVESEGDHARRVLGESDLTYLYTSYNVENDSIHYVGLKQLDDCLKNFTTDMSGVRIRKPAATEKESYLRPGYTCSGTEPKASAKLSSEMSDEN